MILLACLTSGFAGVYFEFILKSSPLSLVLRNVQMAFFGVMFSGLAAWYKDGANIQKHGVMQGFNGPVYVVLTLQAFGGLLVASVVQYTDNVVKVGFLGVFKCWDKQILVMIILKNDFC